MNDDTKSKSLLSDIRQDILICLFLVMAILAVYGQVRNYSFVGFDDNLYITDNRYVQRGLTWENLVWAFSLKDKEKTYWHPLTWLSHIADCHFYGLNAGMHHLTNLLFHMANSLLLFWVFRRMSGEMWQSAAIAALFALHPLNAESVAWIAERKNVLSTFFWMLTMSVYVYYTEYPNICRYLLIFLLFALGLLVKPMLVTLPCVFLLLDYWPLGRLRLYREQEGTPLFRLILEKIPFLILSAISVSLASLSLQHNADEIIKEVIPMKLRVANAVVSCTAYIIKMILPLNLAGFYPYPRTVPMWQTLCAALLLISLSLWFFSKSKQMPYLIVGWLWYLGTFVPVSGLMQGGLWPAMADRWAYVPMIGLFVIAAWGFPRVLSQQRCRKTVFTAVALTVFPVMMTVTWLQVRYWADSITLFRHMLTVTSDNFVAHNGMGLALAEQGKLSEAIAHYRETVRLMPYYSPGYNNLGLALMEQGKLQDAAASFRNALQIDQNNPKFHNNIGIALAKQGRTEEAVSHFQEALGIKPDHSGAHYNFANVLKAQGKTAEAMLHFRKAVSIDPDFADAHYNLATTLTEQGKPQEAFRHFQKALEIKPDDADICSRFALALLTQGNTKPAVIFLKKL